jgi:Flp pilus assembly protein TadD
MNPKILCPHCNAELRLADKFCGNCGKPIEWSERGMVTGREASGQIACATCGTINKSGIEFCRTCGSELKSGRSSPAAQKEAPAKKSRTDQQSEKRVASSLPSLGSWKAIAAVVVIVAVIVAIDMYSSKPNIPAQIAQQQTAAPQQPSGANMSVLPQIEEMEKQVSANPNDAGAVLQLANFLNDNRFYDKAITYYKTYLQKNPKDSNARVDLGICFKEIGQYEDAVREMKKALEYEPVHLFATFNLGIVTLDEGKMYMDQGQMDKANVLIKESNTWFKKTVELAPTSEVGKRAQQLLSQHSNTQLSQPN